MPGMSGGLSIDMDLFGGLVILLVIGGFAFAIIKGVTTWVSNTASDILTRPARVVSKRTDVWGGSDNFNAHTSYYVTFEFQDQTRLELHVGARDYGMIAEGDYGELTFQGTRFKGFQRSTSAVE